DLDDPMIAGDHQVRMADADGVLRWPRDLDFAARSVAIGAQLSHELVTDRVGDCMAPAEPALLLRGVRPPRRVGGFVVGLARAAAAERAGARAREDRSGRRAHAAAFRLAFSKLSYTRYRRVVAACSAVPRRVSFGSVTSFRPSQHHGVHSRLPGSHDAPATTSLRRGSR